MGGLARAINVWWCLVFVIHDDFVENTGAVRCLRRIPIQWRSCRVFRMRRDTLQESGLVSRPLLDFDPLQPEFTPV
jgi:hypothetical protein